MSPEHYGVSPSLSDADLHGREGSAELPFGFGVSFGALEGEVRSEAGPGTAAVVTHHPGEQSAPPELAGSMPMFSASLEKKNTIASSL